MIKISLILPEYVESVWGGIEGYMAKAAEYSYGRYKTEDIKAVILDGSRQLWIAYDDDGVYGAVVTQVATYPQVGVLILHFIGGVEGLKWKTPMLQMLQKFARDCNCGIIESYGRSGWAKIFEAEGAKTRGIFFEIPVE
jgi:hypothetical protein